MFICFYSHACAFEGQLNLIQICKVGELQFRIYSLIELSGVFIEFQCIVRCIFNDYNLEQTYALRAKGGAGLEE